MPKRIPNRYSLIILAIYLIVRVLPIKSASELMARVLGVSSKTFLKTKNIKSNIRDVFPDMDGQSAEALTKEMVENFGRHIAEIAHIPAFRDARRGTSITVRIPEGSSLEDHGPAINVGAHVGSWELAPLVLQRIGHPVTIIYTENVNRFVNKLLSRMREQTGAQYVEKSNALRACMKALEQGPSVGLLVDQRVPSGIYVDFFGRPTKMTRFPAMLAIRFNCPIIPIEVVRLGTGQMRVDFQDPIMPDGITGKPAELELTQRMAEAIEESIKRNAGSWFCSKLRWKAADKIKADAVQRSVSPCQSDQQNILTEKAACH